VSWSTYREETKRRIKEGACARCLKKKRGRGYFCATCRPIMRAHSRRARKRLVELGLCHRCHRRKRYKSHVRCMRCYWGNRRMMRRQKKSTYRSRRRLGLCCECGKRKSTRHVYCGSCRKAKRAYQQGTRRKVRAEMLAAYSPGVVKCACCGETEERFLSIDHIDGGGYKHRKRIGHGMVMWWLRNRGYPPGYRVLCMNCNHGRAYNGGICPHKDNKAS